MKQFIIAEKPSVASDIARVLGANKKTKHYYEGKKSIVTWGYGHLLTLKMPEDYNNEWKNWEMETLPMIPKHFMTKPIAKTKGQLAAIKNRINQNDISDVVIATDAGREGELVARWIIQYTGYKGKVSRLWISSQTDKAIKDGFAHLKPAKHYDALYASAQARSEADWLIGLNVSRALTIKYGDQLSAGRVQTPTLAFIREREKQIESFKPKEEFIVNVTAKHHTLTSNKPLIFSTKEKADAVAQSLTKAQVEKTEEKIKTTKAPLLFDLTELQQEANKRYQFSAKKTLNLTQSLYERHKVVSYPRTDSKYLPRDVEKTMKERLVAIAKVFDVPSTITKEAKVKQRHIFNDTKVSDHYGLIPTEVYPQVEKLSNDEWKIYRLICERFIHLFYPSVKEKILKTTVKANNQYFYLKQTEVIDQGWKKEEAQAPIITLHNGDTLLLQTNVTSQMTMPKKRMTEAELLRQMERHHLGTPATRAEIIEKLLSIQYMERNHNELTVTPKGRQLLTLVNPSLVTPQLTEEWELHLQRIERGKEQKGQFIKQMKQEAKRLVGEIKQSDTQYKDYTLTQKKCPECGERLREKNTKQGVYYVCSNNECTYRRRRDPKVSNHRCNQCHKKMVIIEGKNGAYFKCQTCSLTEKIPDKKEQKKKMTKHEERRLMKKYSEKEKMESPLAAALKDLNLS